MRSPEHEPPEAVCELVDQVAQNKQQAVVVQIEDVAADAAILVLCVGRGGWGQHHAHCSCARRVAVAGLPRTKPVAGVGVWLRWHVVVVVKVVVAPAACGRGRAAWMSLMWGRRR